MVTPNFAQATSLNPDQTTFKSARKMAHQHCSPAVVFLLLLTLRVGADVAIRGNVSLPSPGRAPNVWQYLTSWAPSTFSQPAPPDLVLPPYLRYVELFTATGGCYMGYATCDSTRDLLNDPRDPTSPVNVTSLLAPLRNLRAAGLTPHIVTGNVPIAFSNPPVMGGFGVNAAMPANLTAYRVYLRDVASALVAAFGAAEVATWRWGVFTEFNNQDWLRASAAEYAALYDYTVCGLEDALGVGAVDISVHACIQCGGGAWDALEFLDHVATGTSACRLGVSAHRPFLGNSFYEHAAGDPGTLAAFAPQGLAVLTRARALGLTTARYGIDEGRLLWGPEGPAFGLTTRAVGDAYQGSFDALFFSLLASASPGAYYARWGITSAGAALFTPSSETVDTVAANVALLCYRLAGGVLVHVTNTSIWHDSNGSAIDKASTTHRIDGGGDDSSSIVSAVVAAGDDGILRALVFHHHPLLNASAVAPVVAAVALCGLPASVPRGLVVGATEQRVDDSHANAWPLWRDAATAANLSHANGDYTEGWSAYSDSPPLASAHARATFAAVLPRMQRDAALAIVPLSGGGASVGDDDCVRFSIVMPAHGVALVELPRLALLQGMSQ